jgi:hypothetical protein
MGNLRKMLPAALVLFITIAPSMAELESDWNDFLHYTAIGKFDLAKGYADNILSSEPDPVALLALTEENPRAYSLLLNIYNNNDQLKDTAGELIDLIEKGRYMRRIDPEIIKQEIARLSTTIRGRMKAEGRLKNAGEYAVPFLLDALGNNIDKDPFAFISGAMAKMGNDACRPLQCSLQMDDPAVKAEVVRALGKIGYEQSLAYLKYIYETEELSDIKNLAQKSIESISPSAMKIPSSELFYNLAERYFYHNESLLPSSDYDIANIWFWNEDQRRIVREELSKEYFMELMAMRCCEWALKADPETGKAISLWLNSYFRVEKTGLELPKYFGDNHPDASTYARTCGPEYLHQALSRSLKDNDGYTALGLIEALVTNAGEASLLHRIGTEQPLVTALSFDDIKVRYSSAIAIGNARPGKDFEGSSLIIENLSQALLGEPVEGLDADAAKEYAYRAMNVLTGLAISENQLIDIAKAQQPLERILSRQDDVLRVQAANVLAYLEAGPAQQAIAAAALDENLALEVRVELFSALSDSAKMNGCSLDDKTIDTIYQMSGSKEIDPALRSAAAAAFGSLNLPSSKVKDLLLDQAVS